MKKPKLKAPHCHPILSLKKAETAGAERTASDSNQMPYRAEMNITLVVGKSGFFFFLLPVISFNFLIIILKLILKTALVLETDDSLSCTKKSSFFVIFLYLGV